VRDYSSFLLDRLKQEQEHAFAVAATSHMSTIVFNKHVEFCEDYMKALQELLGHLFAKGPTKKAVEHLEPLYDVRRKHRLWISASVAGALDEFESKVLRIAGSIGIWEALSETYNFKSGDNEHLDRAYDLFNEVMGLKEEKRQDADAEYKKRRGYALVIEHLQEILGIGALTELRDTVIRNAMVRK
jgi:hypothetical protein